MSGHLFNRCTLQKDNVAAYGQHFLFTCRPMGSELSKVHATPQDAPNCNDSIVFEHLTLDDCNLKRTILCHVSSFDQMVSSF